MAVYIVASAMAKGTRSRLKLSVFTRMLPAECNSSALRIYLESFTQSEYKKKGWELCGEIDVQELHTEDVNLLTRDFRRRKGVKALLPKPAKPRSPSYLRVINNE